MDELKEFVDSVTFNTDEETEKTLFNIQIPFSEYSDILPCATRYKRNQSTRSYSVLKPYAWTDVINDAFISQHKLPCNFIYKRAKVSDDTANIFLHFKPGAKTVRKIYLVGVIKNQKILNQWS